MDIRHCAAMIDLETLGTTPGSIILSVGALLFDPFQLNTEQELRTHTFYANIAPSSQPNSHSSADTIAWWAQQSSEAQAAVQTDQQHIADVLRNLYNFLMFRGSGQQHPPAHELWANGPNFDCVLLQYAYDQYSTFSMPLPYYQHYDVRTAKELVWRHGHRRPQIHIGTKHNALDDCVAQAMYVQLAHAELALKP